jgi:hypothetical protein
MEPAIPLLALGAVAVYLLGKKDDDDQGDGQQPYAPEGQPPPQYGPPQGPAPAPRYTAPQGPPPGPGPAPRPAPRPGPQPIPASNELQHLASNLYSIASAPGASCAAIAGPTAAFQQQAAADGHRITVDGKYGPGTVALLNTILARQGLHAPADLWSPGRRCHTAPGARPPAPGTPGDGVGTHAEQLLRDQMGGPIHAGDVYLANGDYNGSVEAFKAAGRAGVSSVAPAIDGQTRGASVTATRQAWLRNGDLAKINTKQFNNRPSTANDAYRAQDIAHQMFDLYARALGVAPMASAGYATGIGTVIPSMYHKPAAACFDAQTDVQLCVAVATALAHETDASKLQTFGQRLYSTGFPMAGTALIGKANMILGGYTP